MKPKEIESDYERDSKKKVLKWLDVGIIYPILDNMWVSPTQVIPKKGGMTVIQNEKNELIPIKIITG